MFSFLIFISEAGVEITYLISLVYKSLMEPLQVMTCVPSPTVYIL